MLSFATVVGVLAFRDLDLRVMGRRLIDGEDEALRVANVVRALGRDGEGISFHLLRNKQPVLEDLVRERMTLRPYIRSVEVVDRFGAPLLSLTAEDVRELRPPELGRQLRQPEVVRLQLMRGPERQGEVRVGISREFLEDELQSLRAGLRVKLWIAAGAALLTLTLGFFYILYLLRKNRQLEQSKLAAERRSYVGLLASGLAHEIRNPLNAMNMNLQMLEEELHGLTGGNGDESADMLSATKSEIKRLERLVNNFLAYARPAEPHFERRNLNEVLESIAVFLKADFERAGVELQLDLEPLLPSVELDETQFKQAVMNLLVNARQVLPDGGTIRLVSRAGSSGEVVLEVEDDGPGMPEEVRSRIFEVFFSSRGGGTGLGLPIANQIVERHGGTIEVESTEGRGTVFRIRLPRRHSRPAPGEAR